MNATTMRRLATSRFDQKYKKTAYLFRTLDHPMRQQILSMLHEHGELHVTDIYVRLRTSQPTASNHLADMIVAGIVQSQKRGKYTYYSIVPDTIQKVDAILQITEPNPND